MSVTKLLTRDGQPTDADPYSRGSYTVELTCTRAVDGRSEPVLIPGGSTRILSGASTVEFDGLPVGAECRVAETATSLALPADQVMISPATVVVGPEPVGVEVTNDYRSGSLMLQWRQRGVGRAFAGAASFGVECTLPGASGSVFSQDLLLAPVMGRDVVESAVLGPIPVGSHCLVTEHSAQGADAIAVPVTMAGAETVLQAELVNEYSAGDVTLRHEVVGKGAAEHLGDSFSFRLTCAADPAKPFHAGTVSITGSGKAVLTGPAGEPLVLPVGVGCWAEPLKVGAAISSVADHGSFAAATFVENGQPDALQHLVITIRSEFAARATLPRTGVNSTIGWWAVLGLSCVALGALLVRRRRG